MDIMTAIRAVVEELECGVEYMFIPDPEKGGFIVFAAQDDQVPEDNKIIRVWG